MRKITYDKPMVGSDGKELTIVQKICLETLGCIKFKTCSWEVYEKGIIKALEIADRLEIAEITGEER